MALAGFKSIPLPIAQLSLSAVLKCGQSFLWTTFTPESTPSSSLNDIDTEYRLCLRDRVVCLRQSSDTLFYRSVIPTSRLSETEREGETLEWLKDYFQLDIDLVHLYKQWAQKDKVFAGFQERFVGIRMLRQDPWENLISFICSSNNNISRITKMVQSLCSRYSAPLLSMEHPFLPSQTITYHPFPSPSALADPYVVSQLRTLGFGYRADFVHRTAKMLVSTHGSKKLTSVSGGIVEPSEIWLRQLRHSTTDDARQELLKFVGVGRKVADCVLLMSLDKREVVPVDTHVHQIARKYYGLKGSTSAKANMTPKLYDEVNSKFFSIWGEYAGWAHSVLFTADLKSFSAYGLSASPASPTSNSLTPKKKPDRIAKKDDALSTPSRTPSSSQLKRKTGLGIHITEHDEDSLTPSRRCEYTVQAASLVDRVKKRRRHG